MGHIDIASLVMGLLGGLALFLFGLELMTDALKSLAGSGMSAVLSKLTRNRFMAAVTGAFATAAVQSSSVTTVLVVGFITAGLMTLPQSIGVIMGANIGSTVTAQIIAFQVMKYALVFVAIGFAGTFLSRRSVFNTYGSVFIGLGMIFLGMGFMSEATEPLHTYQPFVDAMGSMDNPVLGILIAAGFTALVQSSGATTGIVIVLASQGFITLEAGIALAFGANIGTCVTAILAAWGKPREAKQAAAVHLLFNVIGVLIWLPFIGHLAAAVRAISPEAPDLVGKAQLAAETPRQIANAHTLFNVANTAIFIWCTGPMARLVEVMVPKREEKLPVAATPKYLQEDFLETPSVAIDYLRREVHRFGCDIERMVQGPQPAWQIGTAASLNRIVAHTSEHEKLYDAINAYIREISSESLSRKESSQLEALTSIAAHINNVAEVIAVNQVAIGRERLQQRIAFSEETQSKADALRARVHAAYRLAIRSLEEPEHARQVIDMKMEIRTLFDRAVEHLADRLRSSEPNRTVLFRLETQTLECLHREYYFAKRIAKAVAPQVDPLAETGMFETVRDGTPPGSPEPDGARSRRTKKPASRGPRRRPS